MTSTLRHISFRRLGTSETHQRFLEDDRDLGRFLGMRARSVGELLRRAPTGAGRLLPRETLVKALRAYAHRHGAPPEVLASAEALLDPKVHIVVTGQQPGLMGGPLFTLHKAATAIRLCREINAESGGPRVVPLFWNHSDDHDLDEANRFFLINQAQEVQRFRLELQRTNEPLRTIGVGREIERLLAEIDPLMPNSEHRDWVQAMYKPRHPDEKLGDQQARILFETLGKHGLLVIEPRDLPPEAFEPLIKWWDKSDEIRETVKQTCDDLADVGIDVTLDPAATMMFELTGGQREPLADGEAAGRAQDLSPGVLLRPLWQDACLPTIAFVVGPGELAYLCAVASLYRLLGVPQPVFVPRASLTLVEPSMQRLLTRFSLDLPDLDQPPEKLAERFLQNSEGSAIEDALDALQNRLRTDLGAISQRLGALDASMLSALDRARTKSVEEIERLQQKVRNARQNREGTGVKQLRRLCNSLRPRSRPQERVLGPISYLNSYGPGLGDRLIEAADPFQIEHGVLEL
ncbi:MAG TPA: bacillithiol biosynthesis cysteine-adding enzyme BshC [Planctomycetota bacterium]|nr:bacillithiol biosynthesis cysteine-adding enzyme BshC [Planctomycetota bacterium]